MDSMSSIPYLCSTTHFNLLKIGFSLFFTFTLFVLGNTGPRGKRGPPGINGINGEILTFF